MQNASSSGGGSQVQRLGFRTIDLDGAFQLAGLWVDEDAHELVAPPAYGPDVVLRSSVIAEGAPNCLDPTGKSCLPDKPSTPYGVEQFVLCDDPAVMFHQKRQHVENLRLDAYRNPIATQLEARKVENEVAEVPHRGVELGGGYWQRREHGHDVPLLASRSPSGAVRRNDGRSTKMVQSGSINLRTVLNQAIPCPSGMTRRQRASPVGVITQRERLIA